jgi:putative spermidine/putrescine transport system substrate-binding protein
VILLSIARGGDQYNMEPGWKFLKELAKSGNIGRISANTSDIITSLETGETSFTFIDQGSSGGIKGKKVHYLTKTHESLKTLMFTSGWMVLNSSKNKELAFDFANATINKENSEFFFKTVGEVPANTQAEHGVEHLRFTEEELPKYLVEIDWDYVSTQLDGWNKYYEKEIVPLF